MNAKKKIPSTATTTHSTIAMDNDHNTSEAQPYPASGGRSSQSPPYPGLIALLAAAEYIDKKRYISDPSLRNVNNPLLGRDRDLPEDNDSENPEDNDSENPEDNDSENSEDNDSKNPEDNDSEDSEDNGSENSEDNGSEDSEDMNLGPTIGPRARRADVGGLEDDRLGEGMEVDHSADSDGSDIPTSPDSPAAPAAPDAPAVPAAQAAPATPAAVGYDDIGTAPPPASPSAPVLTDLLQPHLTRKTLLWRTCVSSVPIMAYPFRGNLIK